MNRMARQVMEAAQLLMAEGDVFTIKKPIRFKPSYGTSNCIENARMIAEAGYRFVKATYEYDRNRADWILTAYFDRDGEVASHVFRGFSFGYPGEGPHGMMEFGKIFGLHLDPKKVLDHGGADLPDAGLVDFEKAFG